MSSPLIWVIIPLIFAGILILTSSRRVLTCVLGAIIALLLADLAVIFPESFIIKTGITPQEVSDTFLILGRSLQISYENLPFVSIIYFFTAAWIVGSGWFKLSKFFPSIALSISALLIAALSVEPFLYAALLIEIIVLLTIPLLSPSNEKTSKGVLRYLVFQSLAVPFILIAGWLLTGIESAPANSPLTMQATITLIIGFLLLLAIIPFHSWLPMIGGSSHPWVTSFIFTLVPTTLFMMLITFLDRYAWLRSIPSLYPALQLIGTLMIALGGFLVTFQNNLGKAFGYSVIIETGFSMLTIGLNPLGGLNWFSMLLLPRAAGYWLWALCLGKIKETFGSLEFGDLPPLLHTYPILGSALVVAQLSIAGIPFLASFPVKRMIWFTAAQPDLLNALWIFLGTIGAYIFTIRVLLHFLKVDETSKAWKLYEKANFVIPIAIAFFFILFIGLLPHLLLPGLTKIIGAFTRFPIIP
jgi:formate hydrogenlyase subunit 3/multisubunit Na+/H+ antiporter MnhD subunit